MNEWSRALAGARFALLHGPARRVLQLGTALLALALFAAVTGSDRFVQSMTLLATVVGIGLGRQSVGYDRLTGRSVLYFQRAVSPLMHYSAQLLLGLGVLAAAVIAAAAAATLAGLVPYPWVDAVGAFYWGALLLIVSTAASAIAPRRDLELVLLLIALSGFQVLIANWLGFDGARALLRWLLIPVDAVFATWQQWLRGNFTVAPEYGAQLVIYPLVWLAILLLRLRRQDIGAAEYHVS